MKTWSEATLQGNEPSTVALRACVMDMVRLVDAMHPVCSKRPLTVQTVSTAITTARELITSLEALQTHAQA